MFKNYISQMLASHELMNHLLDQVKLTPGVRQLTPDTFELNEPQEGNIMTTTWSEFKKQVEENGIKDEDFLFFISWMSPYVVNVGTRRSGRIITDEPPILDGTASCLDDGDAEEEHF